ncbi:MAG: hypothetical protein WAW06_10755 [bacterium]
MDSDKITGGRAHLRVPASVADQCKSMADAIRSENLYVRYDKVQAARMRVSSGYYDSGHLSHLLACRLLEEGLLG